MSSLFIFSSFVYMFGFEDSQGLEVKGDGDSSHCVAQVGPKHNEEKDSLMFLL